MLILRLWWREGRIVDEKVFGKGFGEVTVERVEKVMKDEKKFWA